jgi:UDP-N-acetyl-D-galactosamine dehydrogenase
MGIDIFEVLAAAGTKWNFLPFKPGLVGGHCIGVDPYYLIEKAKEHGVVPHLFIEARRVNEEMGPYVAERVAKRLQQSGHEMSESSILVLGFTFKENCPDVRNTKVADVYHVLHGYTPRVEVFDPWASPEQVRREYGIGILSSADSLAGKHYDAVVQLVEHDCFNMLDIKALLSPGGVYCDIKKARSLAAEMLGE